MSVNIYFSLKEHIIFLDNEYTVRFGKIICRELNFWQTFSFFLSPNIEIEVCERNTITHFVVSNYQHVLQTVFNFYILRLPCFVPYIFIAVHSFFDMTICICMFRILVKQGYNTMPKYCCYIALVLLLFSFFITIVNKLL